MRNAWSTLAIHGLLVALAACGTVEETVPRPFRHALLTGDVAYVENFVEARRRNPGFEDVFMGGLEAGLRGCKSTGAEQSVAMVKLLILGGAAVNGTMVTPDGDLTTPLVRAAYYCPVEVVDALIAVDADPNQRDPQGVTPLMMAAKAYYFDNDAKVRRLLAAGADPLAVDVERRTALRYAFDNQRIRPTPLVLKVLADAETRALAALMSESAVE